MNVVFTGPTIDCNGISVVRAHLIAACQMAGNLNVQPSVRADTDILVASRNNTVKAKSATLRRITVVWYPEFIARFLSGGTLETGGTTNKNVDKVDQTLPVPDFG